MIIVKAFIICFKFLLTPKWSFRMKWWKKWLGWTLAVVRRFHIASSCEIAVRHDASRCETDWIGLCIDTKTLILKKCIVSRRLAFILNDNLCHPTCVSNDEKMAKSLKPNTILLENILYRGFLGGIDYAYFWGMKKFSWYWFKRFSIDFRYETFLGVYPSLGVPSRGRLLYLISDK
jgi:hypothetical protein